MALFGVLGTGTAVAQETGNACPPASPAEEGSPPCGNNDNGNGNGDDNGNGNGNGGGAQECPPASPNAGNPPPCGPGDDDDGDGDNGDGDNGAAEQCDEADLVVLRGAELVCVYLGENTENAEADCDGAIEVPIEGLVTLCVLPRDTEGAPTPDEIGEVPALPGTLPGL
ncbi:MAG: hypothetical protein M3459_05035 [Actinomycetota bacterium]|nr:hypothetical protein [Actinomycetota bacterium]